jgi:hypothetical protein
LKLETGNSKLLPEIAIPAPRREAQDEFNYSFWFLVSGFITVWLLPLKQETRNSKLPFRAVSGF